MLEVPRQQLSRASSRLAQTAGLASLDLAAEVVAFSYGSVCAAIQAAHREACGDAVRRLRVPAPNGLSPVQVAVVAESSFAAFSDGERSRGRFSVGQAMHLRRDLVAALTGVLAMPPAPPVLTTSGLPTREHFRFFFAITVDGVDPRGSNASPPLPQLLGRVDQMRGPRNDFAHECVDPTQHELVVGRTQDLAGLSGEVAKLQAAISDLLVLFDVLELACATLAATLAGNPPAVGSDRWWWPSTVAKVKQRVAGRSV